MHIPRVWRKASISVAPSGGTAQSFSAWGWGQDKNAAQTMAEARVAALAERIRSGAGFPDAYEYASRPIREEIVESFDEPGPEDETPAMLTRNRYGALILNTSRLLFLDIDLPPGKPLEALLRLLGFKSGESETDARKRISNALYRARRGTFRLYRTAAGFRALAVDRDFEPLGAETAALMRAVGADPAYARLCKAQACFRARLTPKPWRCDLAPPPNDYPRDNAAQREAFATWLQKYESATAGFSSCRFLETIGSGRAKPAVAKLIELHDRLTRANSELPLA